MKRGAKPSITSIQFLSKLVWLDGRPLLDMVEPYRREIFVQALDTFGPDDWPVFNLILAGRGKKNWKSQDMVDAAFYCTLIRRSVQGSSSLLLASDEGQAADDLDLAKQLVAVNPLLRSEFDVLAKELKLKDGSGSIRILPVGDAGGLHGKTFAFLGLDEIHTQADWRILEALQPDPTRRDALTWITSYDSVDDVEGQPLHDLKTIGMAGTDPRMLFSWYSGDYCTDPAFADLDPEARANPSMALWPDQDYLAQQRLRLPPNIFRRLHLNLPSTAESFISLDAWDRITDPNLSPVVFNKSLPVFAGVDASTKHDATAIMAVTWDTPTQKVRLVTHRVFTPTRSEPINFELVENAVLDLHKRFRLVKVLFDPHQFVSSSQRLVSAGVNIEEYPQTPENLTAASQGLYELIAGANLVVYRDKALRLAASRAVAQETGRGWKITKTKRSHHVDAIVALAMACFAAVQAQAGPQPLIVTREHINMLQSWPKRRAGLYGGASWGERMYGEKRWGQMMQRGRRF